MNRIGDFGFGLGVLLVVQFSNSKFEVIFATAALHANQTFEFLTLKLIN